MAGLLEPWTREGISFALRSGTLAGSAAAAAAASGSEVDPALDGYLAALRRELIPEMAAGRRLLTAFSRHPGAFHAGLATGKGWRMFGRFCRGEMTWLDVARNPLAGIALSVLSRT